MSNIDEAPEVQCSVHGTFAYKTDICPICSVDAELLRAKRARIEEEKAAALLRIPLIKAELRNVTERIGIPHYLGEAGQKYADHFLLGAIDVLGRRYARLAPVTKVLGARHRAVVCVPWIDKFAELLDEKITVEWKTDEQVYSVCDKDGVIEVETARE
jgi:hypothetical protein